MNSSATLVAVDIVKRVRPETSDEKQVKIGRISAIVVMILAMVWSTQGGRYSSIFEAVNAVAAHLAPPIATVFLWGVFWRRGTKEAALTTLIFGFSLGVVAFAVDLPLIGDARLITDGWGIPFMMQAWWAFCICSIAYVIVSLLTPEPDAKSIEGLTWEHPIQVLKHGKLKGLSDPRALAGLLFLLMIILYIILR